VHTDTQIMLTKQEGFSLNNIPGYRKIQLCSFNR